MKNPLGNGFDRIYLARIGDTTHVIPVSFSRQRVATAWKGWSDTVLARAGGYGYCKESTALADAIARLIREPHHGDISHAVELVAHAIERTRGTGVESVMRVARENGVEVVESYQFALKHF